MPDVYDDEKEKTLDPKTDGSHDDLGAHPERREAEAEQWQKRFDAKESKEADSKSLSSDQLSEAEDSGGTPKSTKADQSESSLQKTSDDTSEEGFYKQEDGKKQIKGKFWTRRKKAGGGIIGLLIGGTFAITSIVSGPLQFVHIAQLLQRFHFQSLEDNGNGRMLKLYKYAKNKKAGTIEKSRLGIIGNKIADKIDARYASIGLEKVNQENTFTSTYKGMTIDPDQFAENAKNGGQFKGLSEEQFKAKFKEVYNIDLTNEGGKLFAPADSSLLAYWRNKNLNLAMADESGLNKISGSLGARVMGRRDGVTWHPIRAADAKLVGAFDARFTAWLQELKERIKNGAPDESVSAKGQPENDENGKPDPAKTGENDQAADKTNKLGDKTNLDDVGNPKAEGTSSLLKDLSESTAAKGVAIAGVLCALKGISDAAEGVKHDLIVLPLIRMGMMAVSVGNQVMSLQDLSLEQMGFFSRQLYSPEKGSWASARSIQAELGETQNGPDMPDEANPGKIKSGGMFTAILNGIPGLGLVCNALKSPIGGAFSFVVSLATPLATLAQTAVTSTPQFKSAIEGLIRWLAGGPIPTMAFGSDYGNFINYGSRLASNNANASMGGVALSSGQSAALKDYENKALEQDISHRSFAERMFDIYSPDSLASKAIDSTSPNMGSNVASLLSSLVNPTKLLSVFKNPFTSKVSAQASSKYDYGFAEVGFSLDELNSSAIENPYDNSCYVTGNCNLSNGAKITTGILSGPKAGGDNGFIKRAYECFGVNIGVDGSVDSDMSKQIDPSSKDYPKNCGDSDPDWTRVRFYILDMKTAQSSDCFIYGDSDSCQQSGFKQS